MEPATMMALGSAGVGALSGFLGGNEEHVGPGDYVPDWLKDDWKMLGGQIADLQTPEYYQGQLVAEQNPWLQNALGGMAGYGQGMGGDIASLMQGAGTAGLGAFNQGLDYMSGLQGSPNQFQYDQGTFDTTMQNLMPGLQGSFDEATRDINRNLNWNTLPGLDMSFADAQGATKQGQASALARGMAQDRSADIGSQLYQNALNQAQTAAYGAGGQNLASANNLQNQLLSQYGNYANIGSGMLNQAYNMGGQNLGMGLQAGQLQQGYDQSLIDAEMAKHNFGQQAPWLALQNQLNMVNAQKMGSAPQTTGMSGWEGALQGAQTGLGIYDAGRNRGWWGGVPPANPTFNTTPGYGTQQTVQNQGYFVDPSNY